MTRISLTLMACVAVLVVMGSIMVFNTTSAEALDKMVAARAYAGLAKHILFGLLGLSVATGIFFVGYRNIMRLSPFLFWAGIVLLAAVFVPYIGTEINGAKRWVSLGGFSLQPAEFMKYLIPIYYIDRLMNGRTDSFIGFIKSLLIFLIPMVLIMLQPDNGTVVIILATFVILFFLARVKLAYWVVPLLAVSLLGSVAAYHMPHVPDRIRIYLHPETDLRGKGHQPFQAKIAAGSGGLLGRGLGESLQKLNYLPEARSDYIAAIYAEEMGFVGVVLMIFLYAAITLCGFYIAAHAKERQGFYLAAIMTFLVAFQAFVNLGVVSGLLPSKGIALPFFSQGGTALMVNLIAISLVLNVALTSRRTGERALL